VLSRHVLGEYGGDLFFDATRDPGLIASISGEGLSAAPSATWA